MTKSDALFSYPSEFIFAKEVRAGGYKGTEPPAARIDRLRKLRDARAGALWAERVPYVVVAGVNGARLIDIVQEPTALAGSGGMFKINSRYYIEKGILPSIERLLNLLGADPKRLGTLLSTRHCKGVFSVTRA